MVRLPVKAGTSPSLLLATCRTGPVRRRPCQVAALLHPPARTLEAGPVGEISGKQPVSTCRWSERKYSSRAACHKPRWAAAKALRPKCRTAVTTCSRTCARMPRLTVLARHDATQRHHAGRCIVSRGSGRVVPPPRPDTAHESTINQMRSSIQTRPSPGLDHVHCVLDFRTVETGDITASDSCA